MVGFFRVSVFPSLAIFFPEHVFFVMFRLIVARFFIIVARVWHLGAPLSKSYTDSLDG